MITYPLNLLTLPIAIVLWALDSFLFAVALRLLIGSRARQQGRPILTSLQHLVDGVPHVVAEMLTRARGRSLPAWVPWAIVVAAAAVIRLTLIGIVRAFS